MPTHPVRRASPAAALIACLALAAPAPAAAAGPSCGAAADDVPTATSLHEARSATLCLLDHERRGRGRGRMTASGPLRRTSQSFSRQMVRRGFFSHVSPEGRDLLTRVGAGTYLDGARSFRVGENIGWGTGSRATPRSMVEAWMDSPGHRANILEGAFREIGIGIAPGAPVEGVGTDAATYTAQFGRRG